MKVNMTVQDVPGNDKQVDIAFSTDPPATVEELQKTPAGKCAMRIMAAIQMYLTEETKGN